MSSTKSVGALVLAGTCAMLVNGSLQAEIWVLEPSVTLDQRVDDNFYLLPGVDGTLSATRAVGELGLSRRTQSAVLRGLVRVDGLLTTTDDNGDEGLESNQILGFDVRLRSVRSRYGVTLGFKQDTPSRDIAADLSEQDFLGSDTSLNLTQSSNVARREFTIEPYYAYDVSRRLIFESKATVTLVDHDLPDPQDAIFRQYIDTFPRNADGSFDGTPLPFNEVTLADVGNQFTPNGELDDFQEGEFELGIRYKLSPIIDLTASAAYSQFDAEVEPDPAAVIPFTDLIEDPIEREIRRKPRRDSISTTTTFKLGYERSLSPTLRLGIAGGVYTNTSDNTDTLRASDLPSGEIPADRLALLESDTDGWLASVSLTYDAGVTRYAGKFSVDVEPSSSGAQVETQELTGDVFRVLSPRLNFSFRSRAFEPDRLGARREDRFARRFISFEPKIEWKYTRNWTLAAAYRYRRQKAQIDPIAAESNAVLFSIKYTPPSEIRDVSRANGL